MELETELPENICSSSVKIAESPPTSVTTESQRELLQKLETLQQDLGLDVDLDLDVEGDVDVDLGGDADLEDDDPSASSSGPNYPIRRKIPVPVPTVEIQDAEMYDIEDVDSTSEEQEDLALELDGEDEHEGVIEEFLLSSSISTKTEGIRNRAQNQNQDSVRASTSSAFVAIEIDMELDEDDKDKDFVEIDVADSGVNKAKPIPKVTPGPDCDGTFMDMDDDFEEDLSLVAALDQYEQQQSILNANAIKTGASSSATTTTTPRQDVTESEPNHDYDYAQSAAERLQEVASLKRLDQSKIFPDVKANAFHTVAFFMNPNYKPGGDLQPHPATFQSRWDSDYVPMPCSRQNTRIFRTRLPYDADNPEGPRFREDRIRMWDRIEGALGMPMLCVSDIHSAMKQYLNVKSEMNVLKYAVESIMTQSEREHFFSKVLPCIQTLALDTERMVTCSLPLLKKFKNHSVSLSQKQIACLLANAFFSTFPRRENEDQFPTINFIELFQCNEDDDLNSRLLAKAHKLRCILNYFARVADDMPSGVVTYTRKSIRNSTAPKWETCANKLTKIIPLQQGTIEDDGVGMLQVDFANKMIGGGVLGGGAVQEEILFVIYPELLLSRLLTEKLASCEALLVTGCERFSRYTGYARNFRFDGDFFDTTAYDSKGRRCAQIVGIDALYITRPITQFHPRFLTRELNKAYVGFSSATASSFAVATGKWGCGAFNGNPQLKAILQLVAASRAGRDVVFFTFNDAVIEREILEMYSIIKDFTIAEVWKLLTQYYSICCTTLRPKYNLCEFFERFASAGFGSSNPDENDSKETSTSSGGKSLKEVPITHFYSRERESPKPKPKPQNTNTNGEMQTVGSTDKTKTPFRMDESTSASTSTSKRLNDDQIAKFLSENSESIDATDPTATASASKSSKSNDKPSDSNSNNANEEENTPIFKKKLTLADFYK